MKRNLLSLLILACIGFGLSDCRNDTFYMIDVTADAAPGTYPNADEALWPYFKRFEDEAAKRNIDVDLNDARILGVITDIPDSHIQGLCSYSSSDPKKVTVDKPFWNKTSDLLKEFVVFHELGHCFLGRPHNESKDGKGYCKSIMRSGNEDCRDNYTSLSRKKYIDELFIQN